MSASRSILLALGALRGSGLRSGLSTLGVAAAIALVIAMVSAGKGSQAKVEAQIAALGADLVTVKPGQEVRGGSGARLPARPLHVSDAEAIASQVPGARHVAPVASQPMLAIGGVSSWTVVATGTSAAYFEARRWRLVSGRAFTVYEQDIGKSVCILGATAALRLVGRHVGPGDSIRLGSMQCEVVGVLEARGGAGATSDDDAIVAMPLSAFQRRLLGKPDVHAIVATAAPGSTTARLTRRIDSLMRDRRGQAGEGEADFQVVDAKDASSAVQATSRTLTLLLSAAAAISLLIGGIGIMNVMLSALNARTREIGVRLAIGATPRDIKHQFLAEALIISLLGAILGVAGGVAASIVASTVLDVPTVIDGATIVGAIIVASVIGLGFGYGPARRAAMLDPIVALRHH